MKQLRTIIWLIVFLQIAMPGFGQKDSSTLVTLNLSNVSIKELVTQIEMQTDYRFYYDSTLFVSNTFSINIKDQKLAKVLDQVFTNLAIYYAADDFFQPGAHDGGGFHSERLGSFNKSLCSTRSICSLSDYF